ncbi:hypothetical protein BDR26DRAFT_849205 [Obelidium mucronatum]|nr:hypothetical protein BDR26DRAFT_849205 [Obelidium mucronatum]
MESMYWFNLILSLVTLSKFSDTDASIKLVEDVIPLPTTSVTTPYSRRVCTGVSWNGGSSLEINWRLPETTIPGNSSSSFSLGVVITIESLDDSRMKSHRICKVQTISEYDDDICGSWKVLELGVQECIDGLMLREDSLRVSHVGIVVANSWDGVLDDDDGIGKIWIGEVWSGDLGKERHGKSETSWVTLGWKIQDPSLPAVERWELFLSGFWKGSVYFPQYEGYIGRDEDIRVLGFNAYGNLVIELEDIF